MSGTPVVTSDDVAAYFDAARAVSKERTKSGRPARVRAQIWVRFVPNQLWVGLCEPLGEAMTTARVSDYENHTAEVMLNAGENPNPVYVADEGLTVRAFMGTSA